MDQLQKGQYVLTKNPPVIVSPLAAIPKDNGDIRLIHDGSRPSGASMNDYASLDKVKFQTLEDACKMAKPNYFCAKVDLKSAYRSVAIHPNEYKMTGLKWKFKNQNNAVYMIDTRLPFGSRRGPSIFHRISQAVKRCMERRGFKDIVVYIDDFLVMAPTYEICNEALHTLITLLRRLGFSISWPKVVGPTQKITFLGVVIDTTSSTLSLGTEKLGKLRERLTFFAKRKRASKLQLQQLAGLLNWACCAVRGGKFFLRRILDSLASLKNAHHKIRLCENFKQDVEWWLTYMQQFNGSVYYDLQEKQHVHVDACNKALGAFRQGDWIYSVFECNLPATASLHITHKETLAVTSAVEHWAPHWHGKTVVVHTDSTVTKSVINRGRSKCNLVNRHLRKMFWTCAKYNCSVFAVSVSGSINLFADTVSRLHEKGKQEYLTRLLGNWSTSLRSDKLVINSNNTSYKSFVFLSQRRNKAR